MSEPQPQAGQQPPATPSSEPQTPPWGTAEQFDAEKAWNLIQGLRADKDRLSARETITDEQKQQLAEFARIQEAGRTDLERANSETTRWQTEAESWRKAAVGSRVQALASSPDFAFADPEDAVTALADNNYLDAGGQIDEARIRADLADVLSKKPHWRRQDSAPRVPAPNPAQGSGGGRPVSDPAQEFAAILQGQIGRT